MEIATTKLSSRGQIVIPVSLRSGFEEGENLVILKEGEDLIIRKENKFSSMLADEKLLSQDWLSVEDDEAWKDL
jgi:AbrB family looped-hinge helix DNA binding protein